MNIGTSQRAHSMEKYKQWNEIQQWEWDNFDDGLKKYFTNLEHRNKWSSINGFMEGLGAYVKEGLIDMRLVALFGTNLIRGYWEKFGPFILEYRVRARARNLLLKQI